jgi:hypothetical protein
MIDVIEAFQNRRVILRGSIHAAVRVGVCTDGHVKSRPQQAAAWLAAEKVRVPQEVG